MSLLPLRSHGHFLIFKIFLKSRKVDSELQSSHPVHGGIQNQIPRVNLIKINTDGSELKILKDAQEIIRSFRPIILFEIGQYLLVEQGIAWSDYKELLNSFNYSFRDSKRGKKSHLDLLLSGKPYYSTLDMATTYNY